MALWNVTILPERNDALASSDIDQARAAGDGVGAIRSAAIEGGDGPEISQLSLVVDAEDRADACSTACDAAARTLGQAVPFACIAEPLAS